MDVAKYIGLFLLKNNFCYIHGLGNLELKRQPASYNGSALLPPGYDVLLSPSGSIDDNLANFIASNEQISISKASNALRDFSTQARADLSAGREVVVPSIGKFYEEDGKIRFSTDAHFKYNPQPIPTKKTSKAIEQPAPSPASAAAETTKASRTYMPVHTPTEEDEDDGAKLNWPRIILATIVLLALVAIVTFAIKKYNSKEDTLQPVLPTKENAALHNTPPPIPQPIDSGNTIVDTAVAPKNVMTPTGLFRFKAIIESYSNKQKAEKKIQLMRGWGHSVELIVEDTGKYFIVIPMACPVQDTARVLDSLSRLYNPGVGVKIY